MPANQLVFNGINGSTGGYLQSPLTARQVSALAQGKPIEPDKTALNVLQRWWSRLQRKFFSPLEGIDARNLAQTGWGILYASDADPKIREALTPLLKLRQEQAGGYFKEFLGPLAYRPGDTKESFLVRSKAAPGNPADPTKVPYYLLIVGDPETIPYRFQYQLDLEYAVGRIHFDTIDDYERYARSVEAAETKGVTLPRRAVFFGTKNPDDFATGLSSQMLIQPLVKELQGDAEVAKRWEFATVLEKEATKARLARLIGGSETPAFVFTASHGMGFERTDPRQRNHQGALLCQDWPGPNAWPADKPIPEDHYFSADDVKDNATVPGLITFHFACYGAGTPRLDDFPDLSTTTPAEIAPHAFLARLPQRLLTHPGGGALAVIGHVERAWGYSFTWPGTDAQTGTFRSALLRLLHGWPVGAATEWLNQRYANLSSDLSAEAGGHPIRRGSGRRPALGHVDRQQRRAQLRHRRRSGRAADAAGRVRDPSGGQRCGTIGTRSVVLQPGCDSGGWRWLDSGRGGRPPGQPPRVESQASASRCPRGTTT